VVLSYVFTGLAAAWLLSPLAAVICALFSLGATLIFGFYCLKKLQGITGDCVGAVNELAEISVLLGGMVFLNGVME
jgi:cobalamin synthase